MAPPRRQRIFALPLRKERVELAPVRRMARSKPMQHRLVALKRAAQPALLRDLPSRPQGNPRLPAGFEMSSLQPESAFSNEPIG
ncbi:hypothetical protein B1812_08165 [Methylocystis bryophila]|uniref:Uncharacterized protein n=1 Tax=Methylocystis bryophila TaxID=655015 RepID=A0A1W6MU57_9HYPH|nr:hypothetical protein B1812_08165 [Methylocystis bryophila]